MLIEFSGGFYIFYSSLYSPAKSFSFLSEFLLHQTIQ